MEFENYVKDVRTNCENRLECLRQFKNNTGYSYTSKKGKNIIKKSNKFIEKTSKKKDMVDYKNSYYISMLDMNFCEYNNNLLNLGVDVDTFIVDLSDFSKILGEFFSSLNKKISFDCKTENQISLIVDNKSYLIADKDFVVYKRNNFGYDYLKEIELLPLTSPYFDGWQELEKDYPEIREIYYKLIQNNLLKNYENINKTC